MQITIYTRKLLKLLTRIIPVFILFSCADERDQRWKPDGSEEAMVTLALQLPGKSYSDTRGLSEKDENEVTEINVLVFKPNGGEYVYAARCSGSDITTDTGNSRLKTFTVKLKQGPFDIAILANAHDVIRSATLSGLSKEEALAELKVAVPADGKWPTGNFKPFPMWGDVGDITITESVDLTGENRIKLTRMIARVDVQITGEAVNSFKLTHVDVYNYHTEGMLVPKAADWDEVTDPEKPRVRAPYLSATSVQVEEPITYKETAISSTENACTGEIYLFEAENHSDTEHTRAKVLDKRTCLVIGGIWDATGSGNFTGETTYYRVDFSARTGTSQKYLDILRNHYYLFDITNVSGYGHDDSHTAFLSDPVNIEAEVLDWNDAELGEVIFNGQNYLSVTPGLFEFSAGKRQDGVDYDDNILYIKTDYRAVGSGAQSGWYVERIVDAADERTEVNWLTLTPREGSPDVKTEVALTFDANNDPEVRSAVVFIAAGRLRYKVRVTQSFTPEIGVNIYDPVSGNPLNMLLFETVVGVASEGIRFRVDWQPVTSTLFITNNKMGDAEFPSGGSTGTPVTGTINNGTGTMDYLIIPPVVSLDEINPSTGGDPFLDRVSNISFSLSNGTTFVSKSILLRQINYNLIADYRASGYVLNGSEYTIPVKCNSNWMVSDITGDTEILANQAAIKKQVGGYNVTTGDLLKIKTTAMTSDGSNSGKVAYIHLKEVNDKCPPVTIAFKGIECGVDGEAAPIRIGVNGYDNTGDGEKTYLAHMYGGKCWMVQNLREGSPGYKKYRQSPNPPEGARGYYYNYDEIVQIGCPSGWRLPNRSEVEEIVSELPGSSGKQWWASPDYLAGYGNVSGASWIGWGTRSRWMSIDSSTFTANYSTTTYVTTFRVVPITGDSKSILSSVRCVRDE